MNEYHYIRKHFVRRLDCTYITFMVPFDVHDINRLESAVFVLLIMLFFARLTSRECQDKSASTAQSVLSFYQCQVCSLVGQAFLLIYKDWRELDSLSETGNAKDLNLVVSPRVRFLELSNVAGLMRAQQ